MSSSALVHPPLIIEGARVLLDEGLVSASLRIAEGRIEGLDRPANGAIRIDAGGMILAPAFVDIHGDAFERQLMPRPGVLLPTEAALLETDRQLAANGIATASHALTLSWEPGLRSVETGWEVLGALDRLAMRLTVEHRVQLRWETFCFEALPLIEAALTGRHLPSLAFNDHTSMAALHPGTALQDRPFEFDPDFPVTDMASSRFADAMKDRAKRSQMPTAAYVALFREVWQRRPEVPAMVDRVAAMGRAKGAAMLSHDDTRPEARAFWRDLGARVSEFPMTLAAAQAARDGGDLIVMGAPNAARGGSHLGSPGAAALIRAGLCDILASDYSYPAMLAAMARLLDDGVAPLATLWQMVSAAPAKALGLADRGVIAQGKRADLVLVDWPDAGHPVIRRCFVSGRAAYAAEPAGP